VTRVTFHINVGPKLPYACRLLRKAQQRFARVVVLAQRPALEPLSRALWTLSPTDFVPHCILPAPERLSHRSPLVLCDDLHWAPPADLLVNLCDAWPERCDAFERIIELVGLQDDERRQARQRWKHYLAAGCDVQSHDVQKNSDVAGASGE